VASGATVILVAAFVFLVSGVTAALAGRMKR